MRTTSLLALMCFVCAAHANNADDLHDRRVAYLDGGVYVGVGLPYLVTLGALMTPRWRNFDYAPIVQLELHTSIIATQVDALFGLQRVDAGVYRSISFGFNGGSAGLIEQSSSWEGLTLRYQQTTPQHHNIYFSHFWAVDLDVSRILTGEHRGDIGFLPAIHFGWTFAPF